MKQNPPDAWTATLGNEEDARALWSAIGRADAGAAADVDVDAAWDRLSARLSDGRVGDAGDVPATRSPSAKVIQLPSAPRSRWTRYGVAAAAAVAILVLVNVLAGLGDQEVEFANATVAEMPIRLPDDSEATLMPGSRLQYTERDGRREVAIAGEVGFDVREREGMSFAVTAAELEIVVVGTEFMVNHAGVAGVDVTEGHVRVRGRREADWTEVYAGGYARVEDGLVVDAEPHGGGGADLRFRDAALVEVLRALEASHGVTFSADDALHACRVTANLREVSPREAAATLAAVLAAEVVDRAGGYHLRGGACG